MELSRQMSSCKDLVVEPSQLGSLKGLIGTKDTRIYTSSAPYGEGRPTSSCVGIIEVSMTRERNALCLALDLLSLALSRRRVVPLYTRVDALQSSESRSAHRQVRLGD